MKRWGDWRKPIFRSVEIRAATVRYSRARDGQRRSQPIGAGGTDRLRATTKSNRLPIAMCLPPADAERSWKDKSLSCRKFGAGGRTRTDDLLITNQRGREIRGDRARSRVRISSEFLDLRDLADPGVFSRPSTIRPPTSAASGALALLADYAHARQVEMPCGLQHMAVVRIDLLKAMLLGACQVQRVTGSEEDRARNLEDGGAGLFQQL